MPRIAGLSGRSTTWLILRSPRERTVSLWRWRLPIGLRTSRIFRVRSALSAIGLRLRDRDEFAQLLAPAAGYFLRILEVFERRHRGSHQVDGIRAAKRLGQ